MIETIEDFIEAFSEIKQLGWVKTHRSGPTGIGKTLEDLLGIEENNDDQPDFGDYELKSTRMNSQSMLTMFTKTPRPRCVNSFLRERYGYIDPNRGGRKILHATLASNRYTPISDTGESLTIVCEDKTVYIESETENELAHWTYIDLKEAFERKYKDEFVYVKAESRGQGSKEEFYFKEAFLVSGFSFEKLIDLIDQGRVYIDIRIGQYRDGRTHDHGTAFRIWELDFPLLFSSIERIV